LKSYETQKMERNRNVGLILVIFKSLFEFVFETDHWLKNVLYIV